MAEPIKMVPTGDQLGDNEFVMVDPGSQAEAEWRRVGYVPESEAPATAGDDEAPGEGESEEKPPAASRRARRG